MSNSKKHNWRVGTFEGNSKRTRPTMNTVESFMKDMDREFADYDVYLWGSWPERMETWDVDLLLHNPNRVFDKKRMEEIVHSGLKKGLIQREFMPDIGFSTSESDIKPFEDVMDDYKRTGLHHPTSGYIYGEKWYADDKVFKDRTLFSQAIVEPVENNFLKINSQLPYPKMKNRLNEFDKYYTGKPLLINKRKKIYGI